MTLKTRLVNLRIVNNTENQKSNQDNHQIVKEVFRQRACGPPEHSAFLTERSEFLQAFPDSW
jgi:hypothetical protein